MQYGRNFHGLSDEGEFYRERDEWVRHIQKQTEWDASWRLALIALAMRANPKSRTPYPKQTTIASEVGINVRTVRRAIQEAADEGLLLISKRRALYAPPGSKPVNHYSLVSPANAERKHRACQREGT